MARPRRHDGAVYPRNGTKALWIKYRDRTGHIMVESANTEDWQEAQKRLRERLQARDERVLEMFARVNNNSSENGLSSSWRSTQSRQFELQRPTRPTSGPCSTLERFSGK